ncbi:MAG TPA: hypothetical protein VNZ22_18370, partial [Bacillota bacterium]|nr:hypothetical protein [Bacillota bacterium]
MKKCVLFAALMLVFGWAALMGQENLVANPGFEDAPKDPAGLGGGWWVYQGLGAPEVKRDASVARHGKASARVHAETSARCVLVSPHFKVSPADEIRFEVWVRGEHLQTNQAGTYAGIAFRKADGTMLERAYFGCTNLSGGWSL